MAETVDQIEAHIDRTRQRLGSNLKELGRRVETATDWRTQVRARPWAAIAAVGVTGLVVGAATGRRRPSRSLGLNAGGPALNRRPSRFRGQEQFMNWWEDVATALIGVAAASAKDYIAAQLPGFADEFNRAAQRQRG